MVKLGCTVDVASNGLIAVKKFKKNKRSKTVSVSNYDLVLLDLEMPVMGKCIQIVELWRIVNAYITQTVLLLVERCAKWA